MHVALTRAPSARLADCELTYKDRAPIDVALARAQHAAYERALESLGARVVRLPAADELPDAVFVEDAALALDELAIVTVPGAPSRAGEVASVAEALARWRSVHRLSPPATLDGGDVIRVDRTLFVGRSRRTNDAGIAQLASLVGPFGYRVVPVDVRGALHLKTAATFAGDRTILANPDWCDARCFAAFDLLAVPASEPWGASVLPLGGALVMPVGFPRTEAMLAERGYRPMPVDLSELQKAEGGPTCLSIVLKAEVD